MEENRYPLQPVFVVDDEQTAIAGITLLLESAGITHILSTIDSREVLPTLEQRPISVLLLDLSMPHLSGTDLLAQVTAGYPDIPVIIITGHNEIDSAVECMRSGAFDYLVKPVHETRLTSAVQRAIEMQEVRTEYAEFRKRVLSRSLDHPGAFSSFVSNDPRIFALFQYVETISRSPRPVLITGETGVGKEIMARAIHGLSGRSGSFISVNVAGLDDNMFSDTLFGHVRGAFSGADRRRPGLVQQAASGTLFLDEIGDLEMSSQIKLLRLLQENEYYPLGADAAIPAEGRIVVATNQDLQHLLAEQRFRPDLYFRLKTHHVEISPLRNRPGDIPLLLTHLLQKAAAALQKPVPTIPPELPELLSTYHFPGNVRELEAMVFDAVANHRSRMLSMASFREHIRQHRGDSETVFCRNGDPDPDASLFARIHPLPTLVGSQRLLIEEALRRAGGNLSTAAGILGITRSGLSKALKRKGLQALLPKS